MNVLVKRFGDFFKGVISGFDRIVFKGSLPSLSHPKGAENFLRSKNVLNKEYKSWALERSRELAEAYEHLAKETTGQGVEFINSWTDRKEEIARERQRELGVKRGVVGAWSCQETASSYRASFDRRSGYPRLRRYNIRAKHLYVYMDHEDFGFMSIRMQTWFPYHIQICLNGREWLRRSLEKSGADFTMVGNKLIHAADFELVQQILDSQKEARFIEILDGFPPTAFPTMASTLDERFRYYWTLWQSEWATDYICDDPARLNAITESLVKHAFMTGTSQRILRYMGRRETPSGFPHPRFGKRVVSRIRKFYDGVRVRHWLGSNSVKVYNEQNVLRVETTINAPEDFKVWRRAADEPEDAPKKLRPMRKSVADARPRADISQAVNDRMVEKLAAFSEETSVDELLKPITSRKRKGGRKIRALDPTGKDRELFKIISDASFDVNGMSNKEIRKRLAGSDPKDEKAARRLSAKISRLLRLLRDHGLIRKLPHRRRYVMTTSGRQITTAINAVLSVSNKKLMEMAA